MKPNLRRRDFVSTLATSALAGPLSAADFKSAWPREAESPWLGPEYWVNPLQEWRLKDGRIENIVAGGDRNVFLLTHEITANPAAFSTSVETGRIEDDRSTLGEGFAGFRVGIRGHFNDYRDSAVRGEGLNAGITHEGRLFIGDPGAGTAQLPGPPASVKLTLTATPLSGGTYTLTLRAESSAGTAETSRTGVESSLLTGGIALVCHSGEIPVTPHPLTPMVPNGGVKPHTQRGGNFRFWFRNWTVSGERIARHPDRTLGPIVAAMYTLSRRTLKLTVQLTPVPRDAEQVHLETRKGGRWVRAASAPIDPMSRTAHFRLTNWNDSADVPYRVRYTLRIPGAAAAEHQLEGIVRKDPKDKPKLVVGALTCNNDFGFPHTEIARHVTHFQPDILLFTGDQIYERVAEYGIQMAPLEPATLDYLRKWYLFGWAYRDLLARTPSIAMPDDHDVYHGNIWGAEGKKADPPELYAPTEQRGTVEPPNRTKLWQDSGGYKMPSEWVNMVQRTQTSHLPDPFDPTPVKQGISVYYTSLLLGGLSLAIIEDRKWKSAPSPTVPMAKIENGWAQNPDYDPVKDGDVPGAQLLGDRQLRFLDQWAQDWSSGAFLKLVVSQTIFANVATLPPPANNDDVTPRLPILKPDEYPEGERLVADHDSNGWPQTARNQALRAIRRAQALQVGGDQHLGSTVQYGIDTFRDGPWAICTPAISNLWPRRWYPPNPGANGDSRNTGDFHDGFGNKVTVHAVANPAQYGAEPATLYNRAPGYGIIEIDRATRKVRLTNWPRWVDPSQAGAKPFPGWPIEIHQLDNGLNSARYKLPAVSLAGLANPVIQVVKESSGEVEYTVSLPRGTTFTPRVWTPGTYTVKLSDPGTKKSRTHETQEAQPA